MTDQEITIAIAEACGFIRERMGDCANRFLWSRKDWLEGELVCASLLPDYLHDLNAMHEAEEALGGPSDYIWSVYCTYLKDVCGDMGSRIHATARQRCEAFLRVKNLWKETQ